MARAGLPVGLFDHLGRGPTGDESESPRGMTRRMDVADSPIATVVAITDGIRFTTASPHSG